MSEEHTRKHGGVLEDGGDSALHHGVKQYCHQKSAFFYTYFIFGHCRLYRLPSNGLNNILVHNAVLDMHGGQGGLGQQRARSIGSRWEGLKYNREDPVKEGFTCAMRELLLNHMDACCEYHRIHITSRATSIVYGLDTLTAVLPNCYTLADRRTSRVCNRSTTPVPSLHRL